MEENHAAAFESIANDDHYEAASTAANDYNNTHHTHANNDHGWQKVTTKRPRKKKELNTKVINNQTKLVPGIASANGNGVFRSLEKQLEDRRRRILEAQRANVDLDDVAPARSNLRSDDEDGDNSNDEATTQHVKVEEAKKVLVQKEDSGALRVRKAVETRRANQMHGLFRTLTDNMVVGVSKGFDKRLQLVGVGYRATLEGKILVLSLGFSHPVRMGIPDGIQVKVEENTRIVVSGYDKSAIGQFAASNGDPWNHTKVRV